MPVIIFLFWYLLPMMLYSVGCIYLFLMLLTPSLHVPGTDGSSLCCLCWNYPALWIPCLGCCPRISPPFLFLFCRELMLYYWYLPWEVRGTVNPCLHPLETLFPSCWVIGAPRLCGFSFDFGCIQPFISTCFVFLCITWLDGCSYPLIG